MLWMSYGESCVALQLKSKWTNDSIDITSTTSDLQKEIRAIKGKPFSIGMLNDSNFLYIAVSTKSRLTQRQIMTGGFTIWFDHSGGESKQFGIHYPLGMQAGDKDKMHDMMNNNQAPNESQPPPPPIDTTTVELFGPGAGEHNLLNIQDLKQFGVKIIMLEDRIQYNLKIPLTDTGLQPYYIGSPIGSTIGIGFEIAPIEMGPPMGRMENMGSPPSTGGNMPENDKPGGNMQGGAMPGGRGGMNGREIHPAPSKKMELITLWTTLKLSEGKSK